MEALFSTNLAVNQQNVVYQVYEDQGKYVFLPEDNKSHSFSFIKDGDNWNELELNLVTPDIKQQAVDALNRYLFTSNS